MLNVDLWSTLLTLGNPQASSVLLSLTRSLELPVPQPACAYRPMGIILMYHLVGLLFLRSRYALTPVKLRSKSCPLEPFTIRRGTNAVTLIFRGIQISFYISSYCASLSMNYSPQGRRSVGQSIEDSPPVLSFRFANNLFRNPLKWMSQGFPFVLQNLTLRVHF